MDVLHFQREKPEQMTYADISVLMVFRIAGSGISDKRKQG